MSRPLGEYRAKRDFTRTSEPDARLGSSAPSCSRIFMVQKHAATRLHWDFRLEWDGVLLSWAVTRGPSADPAAKRLAVRTEDHPLDYATFEGTIPKPDYGAGTVMLWDRGTWAPLGDVDAGLADGMLKFVLSGERMQGACVLVRMKPRVGEKRENWLLIKEHGAHETDDPEGLVQSHLTSVASGRTMDQIASGAATKKPRKRASKNGAPPPFQPLQLARLASSVPEGDDWLHEIKVDGYRCLASIGPGSVRLYTRNGLDWTAQFGALVPGFEALPCKTALIDGEVVAAGVEKGAFSELQKRLKHGGSLAFVAFDLLHLNGKNMTRQPLTERKAALETLLKEQGGPIRFSTHIEGRGDQAWEMVQKTGREGLVSKRADAPYRAGRGDGWIKLKTGMRQEFAIVGWSPSSARGRPFSSLLMGAYEDGRLLYRGRVGSGFGEREFHEILPLLKARARKTSPLAEIPSGVKTARWVTPDLVAEVTYTELTADGHLRHGVFQGLRADKPARCITLDVVDTAPDVSLTKGGTRIKGVTISHPDRQVFHIPPVSKRAVAEHYASVAERMLRFARNRPISLLRCPEGVGGNCFFQKHLGQGMPSQIKSVAISDENDDSDYITLSSAAGLVAATQMGAVEFHIWGATNAALDRPDRMVFDLDPDEDLPFSAVREAGFHLRDVLHDLGLPSAAMLSGGKGIHVIVPLRPKAGWDTVKLFSQTVASLLAQNQPNRFVATMSKAKRKGRIFIDWLRNERGSTAIAPYALRARPGAKVATPVTWEELSKIDTAGAFDIVSIQDRLTTPCPLWEITRDAIALSSKNLDKLEKCVAG